MPRHRLCAEVLGSLKCDCSEQLQLALQMIQQDGTTPGMVIYLQQEGRGIGLANKIAAYSLQVGGSGHACMTWCGRIWDISWQHAWFAGFPILHGPARIDIPCGIACTCVWPPGAALGQQCAWTAMRRVACVYNPRAAHQALGLPDNGCMVPCMHAHASLHHACHNSSTCIRRCYPRSKA